MSVSVQKSPQVSKHSSQTRRPLDSAVRIRNASRARVSRSCLGALVKSLTAVRISRLAFLVLSHFAFFSKSILFELTEKRLDAYTYWRKFWG